VSEAGSLRFFAKRVRSRFPRVLRPIHLSIGVCLFFVSANLVDATAGRELSGCVPLAVKKFHLPPVGRLPGTQRLRLAFGLPLRNRGELDALLGQLYDPANAKYRQFLTPEQFAEMFGPSEQDYQALIAYAKASGFTVTATHPNRVVLDVEGAVADIERAFHLTMRVYQHPNEARTFYAPDAEAFLDTTVPVLDISGLDDYSLPRPMSLKRPELPVTPQAGSGPSGSYRGNDFRAAYVPGSSLRGTGQNVGLLEFAGYYSNDITSYISQSGISTSTILTNVPVDGGVASPGSGNSEVALDIEVVLAMAPGVAKIFVYEAPNPSPWVDILNRMANDNAAKQLSCSWGGGTAPATATADQIFQQMAAQGQSFFNASGDSDAFTSAIPFPSDNTNITQVGGTTLTSATGALYVSETVWNWGRVRGQWTGSSGGISTSVPIPSYQKGIDMTANLGSTNLHNVPDVALTADNVWVTYNNGSSAIFGGTSCAAPLWAAFTALVNQQTAANSQPPVGFLNPALYAIGKSASYSNCFHDTTTGNNATSSSGGKFPAVSGYDLCTGWGTPNGTNLINTLAPPTTPPTFQLAIAKIGAGSGTVTSSPAGISCGVTCAASFASNTVVTLTATADANSAFRGWSGGCTGTGDCVVTISSNTTRTANFDALPVVSAAAIGPALPTTTNDLVASVTSSNDADGDPVTLAYQWEQSSEGTNFASIPFTSSLLPAAATIAGDYYRAAITPNDGFAEGPTFTTASVLVPADADDNGINDDWEVYYFGQIGIDPDADPDGDGFGNLQEFLAGTDPLDEASALRITSIVISGQDVVVSFTSTNRFYDLQFLDDLTTTNWSAVVSNIPGTGTITTAADVGAAGLTNRFYRIKLLP
jgi:hypothetical protein